MNQQNQHEHYYELEEQRLITFVYQQWMDTRNKRSYREIFINYLLQLMFVHQDLLYMNSMNRLIHRIIVDYLDQLTFYV